jgi:hypothetical protein
LVLMIYLIAPGPKCAVGSRINWRRIGIESRLGRARSSAPAALGVAGGYRSTLPIVIPKITPT